MDQVNARRQIARQTPLSSCPGTGSPSHLTGAPPSGNDEIGHMKSRCRPLGGAARGFHDAWRDSTSVMRCGLDRVMTDEEKRLTRRRFYKAEQEASFVEAQVAHTPQTRSPSYQLAFRDTDFLLREELRPVRFQLELLKPEMLLEEAGIGSTLVCYGSARIPSPEVAQAAIDAATTPERKAVAERLAARRNITTKRTSWHISPAPVRLSKTACANS